MKLWRAPSSLRSHSHPHAALTLPRPPLPYLVLAWEVWSSHFPAPPPSAFSSPSPHLPRCSPSSWPSFTRASESRPYLIPLPLLFILRLWGTVFPAITRFPHSSHTLPTLLAAPHSIRPTACRYLPFLPLLSLAIISLALPPSVPTAPPPHPPRSPPSDRAVNMSTPSSDPLCLPPPRLRVLGAALTDHRSLPCPGAVCSPCLRASHVLLPIM